VIFTYYLRHCIGVVAYLSEQEYEGCRGPVVDGGRVPLREWFRAKLSAVLDV
jgi:hypothetical protein